jgi:hypothetical protein
VAPLAVKRERPKPQLIARLRATLGVEVVGTALFLRVVGNGIEAVGSDCQPQVSAVVGTPGPQGPPGASGPPGSATTLRVFDGEGRQLGILVDAERWWVYVSSIDAIVPLDPESGRVEESGNEVIFSTPDCQGQAYTDAAWAGRASAVINNSLLIGERFGFAIVSIHSRRAAPTGNCTAVGGAPSVAVVPVREVPTSSLGWDLPLPLPIYVLPGADPL